MRLNLGALRFIKKGRTDMIRRPFLFSSEDQILEDNSFPALNLATFLALILITAPV